MQLPSPSKVQPWNGHSSVCAVTLPPTPRCAPRCGQYASWRWKSPPSSRQSTRSVLQYRSAVTVAGLEVLGVGDLEPAEGVWEREVTVHAADSRTCSHSGAGAREQVLPRLVRVDGLSLAVEGPDRLGQVVGEAQHQLVAVLDLDRGLEARVLEVDPDDLLGHLQAVGAELGHAGRELEHLGQQLVVGHAPARPAPCGAPRPRRPCAR